MISINSVTKIYNKTHKAVSNLDISIQPGEIVGFIGPNGAGKTTTIKMLTGILAPTEGSIELNGYNIQTESLKAKKEFGYVSDDPNAFLKLKGIEYLNFIADIYEVDTQTRIELIAHYSQILDMESALNDRISSYSHGMRQKIMIIGVLIHDPNLLILDEPLTGLDPQSSYKLKEIMKERTAAGKSVFFSTHVLEVAEKLCDRIIIINKGLKIYEGTLESLKETYNDLSLEEIFLELTK